MTWLVRDLTNPRLDWPWVVDELSSYPHDHLKSKRTWHTTLRLSKSNCSITFSSSSSSRRLSTSKSWALLTLRMYKQFRCKQHCCSVMLVVLILKTGLIRPATLGRGATPGAIHDESTAQVPLLKLRHGWLMLMLPCTLMWPQLSGHASLYYAR